jgi:hypothetical protein
MNGTGTTTFNGALTISGGNIHGLVTRTLNLNGDTTWTGNGTGGFGHIQTGIGATINNAGLFDDQTTSGPSIFNGFGGAASAFNNLAGATYRKSGSTYTGIGVVFNNTGALDLQGTLELSGGGSDSGTMAAAAGSVIRFLGGTHTLTASSSLTTAGNVTFSGGTVNVQGAFNAPGVNTFSGSTVNFTGTATSLGADLAVSAGTVTFSNLVTRSFGTVTLSGGTLDFGAVTGVTITTLTLSGGTLSGTQTLVVSGASAWTGGNTRRW